MSRRWFQENAAGGWWVPATGQGYAILAVFVAAVLASAWVPKLYARPYLLICGVAYLAISWWFSRRS